MDIDKINLVNDFFKKNFDKVKNIEVSYNDITIEFECGNTLIIGFDVADMFLKEK